MKVKILGLRKVQLSHVGQILITLRTGQILPTVQNFVFTTFSINYIKQNRLKDNLRL